MLLSDVHDRERNLSLRLEIDVFTMSINGSNRSEKFEPSKLNTIQRHSLKHSTVHVSKWSRVVKIQLLHLISVNRRTEKSVWTLDALFTIFFFLCPFRFDDGRIARSVTRCNSSLNDWELLFIEKRTYPRQPEARSTNGETRRLSIFDLLHWTSSPGIYIVYFVIDFIFYFMLYASSSYCNRSTSITCKSILKLGTV